MTEAETILATAIRRRDEREAARKPIDYDRMNAIRRGQKSALTRAINSKDAERVILACRKAVKEWDEIGAWPDDWSIWQNALSDILPWNRQVDLRDLR